MTEKTMDCPILSADGGTRQPCPDAGCPLYDAQSESCLLAQAEACLEDQEALPGPARAALQRLRDAARGGHTGGSRDAQLSFLVSEVEERRKSQEQLLQALSRTETADGALRGEVHSLADRLQALEESLGGLEERLAGVGRSLGKLQTDQYRVVEQLAGDLSRPVESLASRLEESATSTRKVLEDLSGRTDNLDAQGKDVTRDLKALSAFQEDLEGTARQRHQALSSMIECLETEGSADARQGELAQRIEEAVQTHHDLLSELVQDLDQRDQARSRHEDLLGQFEGLERAGDAEARQQVLLQRLGETEKNLGSMAQKLSSVDTRVDESINNNEKLHGELQHKMIELLSLVRGFTERMDVLVAGQDVAENEAERRQQESNRLQGEAMAQLQSDLHRRIESLHGDLQQRLHQPLEEARGVLEAWQGDARQVVEALQRRDQADERNRQLVREQESRELNARGVLLFHQGSLEAAEQAFVRAACLRPDYAEAHNNLGLVQSRLGKEEEAVISFQKAMSCGQQLPAALNNLGFLYHTQMRDEEAVEMFQKALEADPSMATAYLNLGNAYYRQGNNEMALDQWRRALELDPVNEEAQRAIRTFDLQVETAGS